MEVDGDGGSDVDDAPTDAGGPTSDDVGSGSVRIDGVEFGGFEGDCQINRNSGREVVGDLSTSGLTVVVGVDNIDSQPAEELNFVMINEESFEVLNAPGGIESISESGSRTSSGSVDFATVVFAGTLDDGRAVEGEFVCALQNAF